MHPTRPLTFESLLRDPLVHDVMRSDGVGIDDLLAALGAAQRAVAARHRAAVRRAMRKSAGAGDAAARPRRPPRLA